MDAQFYLILSQALNASGDVSRVLLDKLTVSLPDNKFLALHGTY
jgi:hypothetical protein